MRPGLQAPPAPRSRAPDGSFWDPKVESFVLAVQPGGHAVTRQSGLTISTLLGSCVAACICDPIARVGGLNHFLLPGTSEDGAAAGAGAYATRYGAYAMEVLINEILKQGGRRGALEAKLFGGARVIERSAALAVGERNHGFAEAYLRREGIPVTASDVGGDRARRVYFRPAENRVLVQMLGGQARAEVDREEVRLSRAARAAPVSGGVELF